MASQESQQHRNVEEIFQDYSGRRTGLISALTREVEDFFTLCDPAKGSLCLFTHPNESWEVIVPAKIVDVDFPKPVTGINLSRDKMDRNEWLSHVALLSDSWLISVAFYKASLIKFNSTERAHLFSFINDLPTVLEVLTGKIPIEGSGSGSGSKSEDRTKRSGDGEVESNPKSEAEDGKENNENGDEEENNEDEKNEDENNEDGDDKEKNEEEKNKNEDEKENDEDENNEDKEDDKVPKKGKICELCGRSVNEDQDLVECKTCAGWLHESCANTFGEVWRAGEYKCPTCSFSFKL